MSLINTKQNQTMSSREIAELTRKEHKHVMRDVRNMFKALGAEEMGYVQIWTDPQNGQTYEMFNLPKDLTLTLISGYDIALRYKVVKKLEEYETKGHQIPQTFGEALRLAADLKDQNTILESQLQIAQPKVEAHDRIAMADGSMCLTDSAKSLQLRPKDLVNWLKENRWIYRRAGSAHWTAYQDRLQVGFLEHKVTTVDRSDGSSKITEQVRVLPKGLVKISHLLNQNQLEFAQ